MRNSFKGVMPSPLTAKTAAPLIGNVWHDIANLGDSGTAFVGGNSRRPSDIERLASFNPVQFRRLMVPLDGSAFAERALPLAVDIARRAGAELMLVHVDSTSDHPLSHDRLAHDGRPCHCTADLKEHKRAYIERMAEKAQHESSNRVAPIVLTNRDVPTALCDVVNGGVDLVVMGAYGKGMIRRWVSGSTVHELIRRLAAPLIVVGSDGSFATPVPDRVSRILIAVDGSQGAEQVLGPALALGEVTAADHVLLRVVDLSTIFGPLSHGSGTADILDSPWQLELAAARRYLRKVAKRMERQLCVVDTRVVLNEWTIARTIAANARAYNADVIAIATRKDANKRWLGSIAERVVQFASVPVLVAAA
jgi:nucleotide-binding universal stress UspA family protein